MFGENTEGGTQSELLSLISVALFSSLPPFPSEKRDVKSVTGLRNPLPSNSVAMLSSISAHGQCNRMY